MDRRRAGRWLTAAVTAWAAALTLAVLPSAGHTAEVRATAAPLPETPVSLDLRALGRAAALESCAGSRYVDGRPGRVSVRYGMLQRTPSGTPRGSFVLRNHAGRWRFCDMLGADSPSRLPMPRPSAERPAVYATNPDWKPVCREGVRTGMRTNAFLRVHDPVHSARTRFWVDGVAQPWFTSRRQGRFVHLQSWAQGLPGDARLKVQIQLRDRAGDVLAVRGFSSKPQLMGNHCIQIG